MKNTKKKYRITEQKNVYQERKELMMKREDKISSNYNNEQKIGCEEM